VILATLGVAFWFRASNERARYRPNFAYSGRLEMLVWSIPAMTVFLVGGVAWVGSHDLSPRKPIASTVKPLRVQVASLDWKWLFIYPDEGVASVNYLAVPVGTPVSFELTSSGVMNSFFVPQLGSQIYTMAGMVTRLHLQADQSGSYRGMSAQYSGEGFADMYFNVEAVAPEKFSEWVDAARKRWWGAECHNLRGVGQADRVGCAIHLSCGRARPVRQHPDLRNAIRRRDVPQKSDVNEGGKMNLLGKLNWNAIPFDQPIIMGASGGVVLVIVLVLSWVTLKGYVPTCGESGSPLSTIAHRHHVHHTGVDHAAARFLPTPS